MSAPTSPRRLRLSRIAILTGLLAALAVTAPWAAATGSGYNQSFTRAAGSTSVGAVDLTSVSSVDPGASSANLTISFGVSGTLNLQSSSYFYFVWFGGSSSSNATGYVSFSNSTTGSYYFFSSGTSSGTLPYTNSGSTLTFHVAKSAAGPASSFAVNVDAYEGSAGGGAVSWLGTNYAGGGGATCTTVGCVTTTANTAIATAVIVGVIALVVIVVVIVVVVVLVMRKRKAPPPPPMMPGPMAPPLPPPPPQQ